MRVAVQIHNIQIKHINFSFVRNLFNIRLFFFFPHIILLKTSGNQEMSVDKSLNIMTSWIGKQKRLQKDYRIVVPPHCHVVA